MKSSCSWDRGVVYTSFDCWTLLRHDWTDRQCRKKRAKWLDLFSVQSWANGGERARCTHMETRRASPFEPSRESILNSIIWNDGWRFDIKHRFWLLDPGEHGDRIYHRSLRFSLLAVVANNRGVSVLVWVDWHTARTSLLPKTVAISWSILSPLLRDYSMIDAWGTGHRYLCDALTYEHSRGVSSPFKNKFIVQLYTWPRRHCQKVAFDNTPYSLFSGSRADWMKSIKKNYDYSFNREKWINASWGWEWFLYQWHECDLDCWILQWV